MKRFWKKGNKTAPDAKEPTSTGEDEGSAAQPTGDDAPADEQYPTDPRKARSWFERAKAVSDSGQHDYAIQCYLFGLRFEPDAMDQHEALLEVALKRKVGGGKPAGFRDKPPISGKHPIEKMLEAEYKWAKDPQNPVPVLTAMEQAVRSELDGMNEVAWWMGTHVVECNRVAKKPSRAIFIKVRDLYSEIGAYDKAAEACRLALALDPQNVALARELRALETERTIMAGRYDETEGGFQKSVKDLKGQVQAVQEEAIAKTEAAKDEIIKRARHALVEHPDDVDLKNKLARALLDKETEQYENEAIQLFEQLYKTTGQFRFRVQIGDTRMKQFNRTLRDMRSRYQKTPSDELKQQMRQLAAKQLKFELQEYTERVDNYPTDMGLRYELGRRQFAMKDYDAAISSFQQSRSDPKHRAASLRYLGEAFAAKQWWDEAIDTFRDGISNHPSNDDHLALVLRYNLMDALEGKARRENNLAIGQEAAKVASQIAQVNINFKDIRTRIEKLRALVENLRGES